MLAVNGRQAEYPIEPVFLERWSPRAFTEETLPIELLLTMLEAARWAASSFNTQPWRFVYALRGGPHWRTFLDLLIPFNQDWAKNAAALVFAVSKTTSISPRTGQEHSLPTHAFDTGAACAYLVLQALRLGWHAHGMVGFDPERARSALAVPQDMSLLAVFAIGRRADPMTLPESIRGREFPSDRLPLQQLVFEGNL